MTQTLVKKIHVKKFRGLKNIDITFGQRMTIICGKNGTSKSTILGILAQIFSFRTDYSNGIEKEEKNKLRAIKTLFNTSFESQFSDHFRFSEEHDLAGSMDVDITLFDGLENIEKDLTLTLVKSADRAKSRPVLRGNHDRNVTHPVIFLSTSRLTTIADRKYELEEDNYLEISENKDLALKYANQILLQNKTHIDPTGGVQHSIAISGNENDFQSISVGEDVVGKIVKALLSFKKVKEEFQNYSGGLLLIDEVDAGLFPAAQIALFNLLSKFCREYQLQVIMTTHSPSLIEKFCSQKDTNNYKVNYLTNTYGKLEVRPDFGWLDIEADIYAKTKQVGDSLNLPIISLYCEDDEAQQLIKSLVIKRKLTKITNIISSKLGAPELDKIGKNFPELINKNIFILDGDVNLTPKSKMIKLPGELPPDQLLYDYLQNLSSDDAFWQNSIGFTKSVFDRIVNEKLSQLNLQNRADQPLREYLEIYRRSNSNQNGIIREAFKNFYKDSDVQKLFKIAKTNPFRKWAAQNQHLVETFESELIKSLKRVYIKGYGINEAAVNEYFDN